MRELTRIRSKLIGDHITVVSSDSIVSFDHHGIVFVAGYLPRGLPTVTVDPSEVLHATCSQQVQQRDLPTARRSFSWRRGEKRNLSNMR